MTVENAHAFLDELKEKGTSPELMSKIGTDFKDEHICQALKERGTSKDELLKAAAGGTEQDWAEIGAGTHRDPASGRPGHRGPERHAQYGSSRIVASVYNPYLQL